jgi:hypothetical protein
MAFTAQTYRRLLGTRPSSAAQLQTIRNIVIMSIHTMDATQDSDEFAVLCYVLRAIVYEIEPIPLATVDLQTGLQVHESHPKRRRSSAGERSPLEISDIPRRKLGRFETRTRATHANTYVPPTPPQARSSIAPPLFNITDSSVPIARDASYQEPLAVIWSPDDTHSRGTRAPGQPYRRPVRDNAPHVFGALSRTGTCNVNALSNITDCGPTSVQGAFGPSTQPTKRGKLGPLGLDAILLPGLGNQTLISLSQFCAGSSTGVQNVGVFAAGDFRMFRLDSILPALKLIAERGQEVARGVVIYRNIL